MTAISDCRDSLDEVLLAVLVPVYNEEENIKSFVEQLHQFLDKNGYRWNVLFIDDGSSDQTNELLQSLAQKDSAVRYISLSRNFGKEAAMTAGIDYSDGDLTVIMDGDFQHPISDIPRFVEKWQEGFDVVYGIRVSAKHDRVIQQLSSRLFFRIFNFFSDVEIPYGAGDFRLVDKRVIEALRLLPERSRFMKGLHTWVGFKTCGVRYFAKTRERGETKWSRRKLFGFAITGLIGFSNLPLRVWSAFGMIVALSAFIYGSVVIWAWLVNGHPISGYSTIVTLILFLGGVQLISIGVLGEYLARTYMETKKRPVYVVREVGGIF